MFNGPSHTIEITFKVFSHEGLDDAAPYSGEATHTVRFDPSTPPVLIAQHVDTFLEKIKARTAQALKPRKRKRVRKAVWKNVADA